MYKQKSNFKTRLVLSIVFFLFFLTPKALSEADISIEDIQELEELKQGQSVLKDDEKFLEIQTSVKRAIEEKPCVDCIYGYDLFVDTPTTFALSSNTPLPQDYILGPGDKLAVEYFGNNSDRKEAFITRSGRYNLPLLGPVNLSGMLFSKAEELIANKVKSELIGTEVFLSVSQLRSISVYVVGAAYKPGTYTVNSLSTLTNVIFSTGGPDRSGSLRNIQLKRKGKLIKDYDFYKLLLNGDTSEDMRLLEGDTIFYPLIESSVRVNGAVRRPGLFEIKEDEKLADILNFSGVKEKKNFKIQFSRFDENNNTREVKINIITDDDFLSTSLKDSDSINILTSSQKAVSNILLSGEFKYPGYYDISTGESLLEVIEKAGGFTELAYPEGSVFTRKAVRALQKESYIKTAEALERSLIDAVSAGKDIESSAYAALSGFISNLKETEPNGRQVVSVDEYSLRTNPRANISLQDGDTLFIPKRSSSVTVVGEVLNSSTHLFSSDLSVADYLELSGGITNGADPSKIFVILPNGQSTPYQKRLFQDDLNASLLPGSTIVVSRNPDPFNWLRLTSVITPILSDLAVSAAAVAAISDNN